MEPPPHDASGLRHRFLSTVTDAVLSFDGVTVHSSTSETVPPYRLGMGLYIASVRNADRSEDLPQGATPQRSVVTMTVNRFCRMTTIISLGCWGGWSLMPAESKWVAYICIITDWVVLSTVLDCMWPDTMDWYFCWCLQYRRDAGSSRIPPLTACTILNISIMLGVALLKFIKQKEQPLLTATDLIVGGPIGSIMYLVSRMDGREEGPGRWFFYVDRSPALFTFVSIISALTSWWWIALRILAIVNILRNRHDPNMALQFLTLTFGLGIEGILLLWFFSIPLLRTYVFKMADWDRKLWRSHLNPLIAMFASWALVVVTGWWVNLPNILFPCSGSTSVICSAMETYLW
ncbi:hypothetical protein C8J56DRAFT_908896 [Mycena floridula]|nr:hypothetical protein C8J56DRAFT_908896 [Mycena floridula]